MEKQFDDFIRDIEKELFKVDTFEAIGKGDDYKFQALAFAGNGSHQLSLATTILSDLVEVPEELKAELKSIQNQLNDFKDKLREV